MWADIIQKYITTAVSNLDVSNPVSSKSGLYFTKNVFINKCNRCLNSFSLGE